MTLAEPVVLERAEAPPRRIGDLAALGFLALSLTLIFEPFATLFALPGSGSSVVAPAIGVGALALASTDALRRVPVSITLLALVLWFSGSLLWADSEVFTAFELRSEVPLLVMLWLVIGAMKPEVATRVILGFFVVSGVWNLLAPLALSSVVTSGGWGGTFGHKNTLGIFMVLALSAVLAFERPGARRTVLVVAFVGLIMLTRSATAASGLLAMLVAYFWLTAISNAKRSADRAVLKLLSLASIVVAVLLALELLPALVGLYGKDVTFTGRTDIWAASLNAVSDRPLQGYGVGGVWVDGQSPITRELWARIGFPAAHAHSGALNLTLEVGLVGLALYVLLVAHVLRLAFRCLAAKVTARYGLWAVSSVFAILLMSLSEPLFRGPTLALVVIMWTVLARVTADQRRAAAFT